MYESPARDETVGNLWQANRGRFGCDPEITCKSQVQPVADNMTVDSCNGGLGESLNPGKDLTPCLADRLSVAHVTPEIQVTAGAEYPFNPACDH